jgi:hypothetical protein
MVVNKGRKCLWGHSLFCCCLHHGAWTPDGSELVTCSHSVIPFLPSQSEPNSSHFSQDKARIGCRTNTQNCNDVKQRFFFYHSCSVCILDRQSPLPCHSHSKVKTDGGTNCQKPTRPVIKGRSTMEDCAQVLCPSTGCPTSVVASMGRVAPPYSDGIEKCV